MLHHNFYSNNQKTIDFHTQMCFNNINQTDEAGIKTVRALYRESGLAESRIEMQTVKWVAEGTVKGVQISGQPR